MDNYPKKIKLKDGAEVVIRPLQREDKEALLAFFKGLPDEDRQFLKEDVTDESVVNRWIRDLDYDRVLPLVAEQDGGIIGDASLHFNRHGWFRHMAELRCVVAKDHQKRGLGSFLMRELLSHASDKGIEKIMGQLTSEQETAFRAFSSLGFEKEAELKDFVCDIKGKKHNIVLMVNNVIDLWEKMENMVLEHEIRTQW